MRERYFRQQKILPPFKSVAGALIFTVILGPIGLLYSSLVGGVVLMFLLVAAIGNKYFAAAGVFWVLSCVWGVAAVNLYNKKIIKKLE